MNRIFRKLALALLISLSVLFPAVSFADAGKAIFVYGKAYVESADGTSRVLNKGSFVASGDTITTSSNGRVQLQMADGGLLALRPGTEFVIEQFNMPSEASADAVFTADGNAPRSFFTLVKGGFRSITGAIGKENKANYRVTTPVATIGIRGTDYDAVYCAGDCQVYAKILGQPISNGLYVGVNSGGVRVTTDAGSLDLDQGQFGFARDAAALPGKSRAAAEVLSNAVAAAVNNAVVDDTAIATNDPDTGLDASDDAGNETSLVDGTSAIPAVSGAVAFSAYSANSAGVSAANTANQVRDAAGNVVGFNDGAASLSLQNSTPVNVGRDNDRVGATGLSWGRWADGDLSVADNGVTTSSIDSSVHYVAGSEGSVAPVLPTTGSANFELIGNTDPTDNRGNAGTLGSADLSANFDAQTVDADVSLSFQETSEVWNASANDVDINSSDATFAGEFDAVTVLSETGTANGNGNLGGFFSGDADGNVSGAGMTFTLNEGSTEVNGSAAFQVAPASN